MELLFKGMFFIPLIFVSWPLLIFAIAIIAYLYINFYEKEKEIAKEWLQIFGIPKGPLTYTILGLLSISAIGACGYFF